LNKNCNKKLTNPGTCILYLYLVSDTFYNLCLMSVSGVWHFLQVFKQFLELNPRLQKQR